MLTKYTSICCGFRQMLRVLADGNISYPVVSCHRKGVIVKVINLILAMILDRWPIVRLMAYPSLGPTSITMNNERCNMRAAAEALLTLFKN